MTLAEPRLYSTDCACGCVLPVSLCIGRTSMAVWRTVDQVVLRAVARARRKPASILGGPIFNFIRDTLLQRIRHSGPATPEYRAAQQRIAGKFQQLTAPTMAKGFEDTALYVYIRDCFR